MSHSQKHLRQLCSQGFPDEAAAIITHRQEHLSTHARRWANDDDRWLQVFTHANGLRQELALLIEHAIRIDASAVWKERVFALAQDWGVVPDVVNASLERCIGNGWFDIPVRGQRQRPTIDEIREQFVALLQTYSSVEARAAALVKEKRCRDIDVARLAAREFMGPAIQRRAINRACAIISAWGAYNRVGLLCLSHYPFYEELRLVESYVQDLPPEQRPPAEVIADVRADVMSVCTGLCSLNSKHCTVYHAHLWTEPPRSSNRKDYVDRFHPRLKVRAFAAIGTARGCDLAEAETLFNRHIQGGISATLDGRWLKPDRDAHHTVETTRFMAAVHAATFGIEPIIRVEIERLSLALLRSLEHVNIPFSRVALVTESPSSRRRRRWGRRLTFGVPAIVRQRHKRRREHLRIHAHPQPFQKRHEPNSSLEDDLIAEFARQSSLTLTEATDRLRNMVTYGVLGLVPRSHWYKLFDERLVSWLKLIKFGHPERSIRWSQVYQGATMYARELAIALPSSQVLQAVYNSIAKPRYWHGGKGLLMIGVHQRTPRVITGRPHLHAAWFMVWITIPLGLSSESNMASGRMSHLILTFDEETELLMGAWVGQHPPDSRDVALAFYQSIWHPGIPSYPLRGIPNVLCIPKKLLVNGEHIRRAAAYLLADIEVTEKSSLQGKKRAQRLIADIREQGVAEMQRRMGRTSVSEAWALRFILDWIKERTFPYHRQQKAPLEIRKHLVAMPGHDTPAAGWLLPVVGQAEVVDGGVWFQDQLYTSSTFHAEPGQELPVRSFPFFYPTEETFNSDAGVFVEVINDKTHTLEFLTRQTSR